MFFIGVAVGAVGLAFTEVLGLGFVAGIVKWFP